MNAPALDRSQFIGGSDIGAILGVSKWSTPLDLYLQKTGQAVQVIDPDRERIFRRGKRMEPIVIEMLEDERGYKVVNRNQRYVDPDYPFMACEVDAEAMIDDEHCNLEIKTSHPFAAGQWGIEGTDEIDVSYAAQAMWGLMITGRRRCVFGVLVGSDNLSTYEVIRDEETIAGMRKAALQFWNNHVLAGIPPAPVNLPDVYNLFNKKTSAEVQATPELAEMVSEYAALKRVAANAEEGAEDMKYKIGVAMLGLESVIQDKGVKPGPEAKPGNHVLKYGGKDLLTIRLQSATRIDNDTLRQKYPAIVAECSKSSSFYSFNLSRKK